jgi:hypothetical protein
MFCVVVAPAAAGRGGPSRTRDVAPPLAAVPASQTSVATDCPAASAGGDPRFGVVMTGSEASVPATLQALGATGWFRFDSTGPRAEQATLVRPGADPADLARRAAAAPGGVWLIGNEPNVPGQDDVSPQAFADFLAQVASAVRQADPAAVLVGPNVLNWDKTCTGCPGYGQGLAWSEAFLASYVEQYGPLPLDVWGMHAYSLDWDRLPLVDAAADQSQLAAARAWLDAKGLNLPIWLTEFGVIWGFEGVEWIQRPDGRYVAEPRGEFRTDLMAEYLDQMFGWLTGPGAAARVERWYLYATAPPPEPWSDTLGGIALLDPGSLALTGFGERYRAWAIGCGRVAASS